ncbi:MAG: hypothetical protein ACRENA_17225 [Vulcanimicrobiaceae bacterium]
MDKSELAARVARLESSVKRDRTIAIAALAILFATAQSAPSSTPLSVRGQQASTQVTASGLVVRDSNSQLRVFIGLDSEGRPSVDLRDSTGKLRQTLFLTSGDSSPTLRQFDATGTTRLEAYLSSPGEFPNFRLLDKNGKRRLSAFIGSDSGNPELGVFGSDEQARAYLVGEDRGAYFDIRDASKTIRAQMGVYPEGGFGMFLANSSGQTTWRQDSP